VQYDRKPSEKPRRLSYISPVAPRTPDIEAFDPSLKLFDNSDISLLDAHVSSSPLGNNAMEDIHRPPPPGKPAVSYNEDEQGKKHVLPTQQENYAMENIQRPPPPGKPAVSYNQDEQGKKHVLPTPLGNNAMEEIQRPPPPGKPAVSYNEDEQKNNEYLATANRRPFQS
jgi:hypothetical protein